VVLQEIGPTFPAVLSMKMLSVEFLKSNSICMISEQENFKDNITTDLNLELLLQHMPLHQLILHYPPMEAPQSPQVFIPIQDWIKDIVSTLPNQEFKLINKIRKWTTE